MRLRGEALGTLNLFGRDPNALGADDVPLCQALADIATISLLQDRALRHATIVSEQLQHALDSRVTIEQAKGKLAERHGIDIGEALDVLREHARRRNQRLLDVAAAVLRDRVDIDAP
jgi:AmiR/NasT family two-component response regulator